MRGYLVINIIKRTSKVVQKLSLAANAVGITEGELEHYLDEEGVCETDCYSVVECLSGCAPYLERSHYPEPASA